VRVVIIDGGAGVGKDALAHIICSYGSNGPWVLDHFDVELEERCHGAYKLFNKKGGPVPSGFFENQKDVPLEFFHGMSARSAYENFREWAESTFGLSISGRWLLRRIDYYIDLQKKELLEEQRAANICLADAAPPEAIKLLEERFGRENFIFIDMFRPGVVSKLRRMSPLSRFDAKINNDGTLQDLEDKIKKALPALFIEMPMPKQVQVATEMPKLP